MENCTNLCNTLLAFLEKIKWLPPLLTRITVGWIFAESGWGKLHNLKRVASYFDSLGIPAPQLQAPFVATTEFVCGWLLLIGLATRIASVPLIATMIVAILTAKRAEIGVASDLFGMSEFLYIVLLICLIFSGPGKFSADHFVSKKLQITV